MSYDAGTNPHLFIEFVALTGEIVFEIGMPDQNLPKSKQMLITSYITTWGTTIYEDKYDVWTAIYATMEPPKIGVINTWNEEKLDTKKAK
jgi:hypothetical protein